MVHTIKEQYTLDEYTKIHGFDFYIYDETIDGYLMEEYDDINTDCLEWERIKDEVITGIDETLNAKITLYIATIPEDDEEEELKEWTREDYEAYWADLEYHDRDFEREMMAQ